MTEVQKKKIMSNIKEYKGDLFKSFEAGDIDIMCQGCNDRNTFGFGVALSIKKLYPKAFEADTRAAEQGTNKLGFFSLCKLDNGQIIVNLYSQKLESVAPFTSRRSSYEAVAQALERLKIAIGDNEKKRVIGMPCKIFSCLGGANWDIIRQMIISIFEDSPIDIHIIELES